MPSRTHLYLLFVLLLSGALALSACPSSGRSDDDDDDSGDDDDTGDDDTGDDDTGDDDTGDDDDIVDDDDIGDDDDSSAEGAVLSWTITRSATLVGDGIGPLTVAVLPNNPGGGSLDQPLGTFSLESADFSQSTSTVSFIIYGIPPRADPYFVTAFLDDDESGTESPPTNGDLFASGASKTGPTVVMDSLDTFTLDLDLDIAIGGM